MTRWLIRVLVILAGPAIGWFQISETTTGILVGVGCSLLVIALEMMIERIPADRSKRRGQDAVILDTSVIIDGRITDICQTRFVSARFIVPRFVLNELHALADSGDSIKRQRGRRGLDILAQLQEIPENGVTVFEKDYPTLKEVDAKLVELAKELEARVMTTDFNLNKIASVQGVRILNINDLANALKAVVLPGESMNIFVVKEGKEKDQGVAYLDDGTMVVVEEGRRLTGKRVEVVVSTILQTSAGRMIFTKPKEHSSGGEVSPR